MNDLMVEKPMIMPQETVGLAQESFGEKIRAYNEAIDLLDDQAEKICFPHADIYRAEIYRMQRRMQDEVFRLEDGHEQ